MRIGDFVIFIPNGLIFRIDNNKMLKWMEESGNYRAITQSEECQPSKLEVGEFESP